MGVNVGCRRIRFYCEMEESMKDPNELWGHDNQAFCTVREYLHAIRTTQTNKGAKIYSSNLDLTEYFDFVRNALNKNPYYAL